MKKNKFTIISPTYNASSRMKRNILSLKQQTYDCFEYIIVDGLSKDNTVDECRKYIREDRRFTIISENDDGIYDAMNKGIRIATGDFVIILGAGDYLHDTKVLEKLNDEINGFEADIYYGFAIRKDGNKKDIFYQKLNLKYKLILCPVCHQAVIAKRELFNDKLFDTRYSIAADQDWIMYNLKHKKIFKYVNMPISVYLLDGVSSSVWGTKLYAQEKVEIQREYYRLFSLIYRTYITIKRKHKR